MQQNFIVMFDADTHYQISIAPFGHAGSACAVKHYPTKEQFVADLQQRFQFTDKAVARLLADPERYGTLADYPLSEDDQKYFGWIQ